ncbi:1-aminocyclopropane-1-carboxylate oxidase-like protein 1-like [Hibiscus syriacus]|uniref:galactinol--sucrose galactosyltransferase n=1 Tax=Hibiscus syriacus TaxID=106335 RepID=A0A6A3D8C9_HIBSY|nr:1-aminocyclopropane-1-carboxylate oxidase-like protein 1-like [Hibiscus syriacus]
MRRVTQLVHATAANVLSQPPNTSPFSAPFSPNTAAFVGATSSHNSSRYVFKPGVIKDVRLLCLFRFKLWWMIPRTGSSASDIPLETQMLLLEAKQRPASHRSTYILFLPVLADNFRSSLQGNSSDEIEFCVESGDPAIVTSQSLEAIFVNYGDHPFDLVKDSMMILEKQLGTFGLRETKQMPEILDWFGWCTRDAFYSDVNPQGIKEGIMSLSQGGTPAKFPLIDDGWQDTINEFLEQGEPFIDGLQYVYVWHALHGYWGGLDPKAYGIGVVDPDTMSQFYDDLHGYLASQDVDGVKVDAQNISETISEGLGGRVSLARQIQQALERSIAANFSDNGIICCMAQSTDSIYHLKQSAISRASFDFYPKEPTTWAQHVAAVAFNSILLGELVVPDWDMFYSLHDAAEFHAVARAVGGCGVYVSDKPGRHDFEILQRLVLLDGSVLRAKYAGRPSQDCLFTDPVTDGKSLLKIWNLNKCTGVVGIFNCHGTWPGPSINKGDQMVPGAELSGQISPACVEYFEEVSGEIWTGESAVFSFNTGGVSRLPMEGSLNVILKPLECDVFTVSPIKVYNEEIEFAAIGLVNMYNSGGALESVEGSTATDNFGSSKYTVHVKGRGAGCFGAYSNCKPISSSINMKNVDFNFNAQQNLLTITIPPTFNSSWDIAICY